MREDKTADRAIAVDDGVGGAVEPVEQHLLGERDLCADRVGPVRDQDQLARRRLRHRVADRQERITPTVPPVGVQAIGRHVPGAIGDRHRGIARHANEIGPRRQGQFHGLRRLLNGIHDGGDNHRRRGDARWKEDPTGQRGIVHAVGGRTAEGVVDRQAGIGGPIRPGDGEGTGIGQDLRGRGIRRRHRHVTQCE